MISPYLMKILQEFKNVKLLIAGEFALPDT